MHPKNVELFCTSIRIFYSSKQEKFHFLTLTNNKAKSAAAAIKYLKTTHNLHLSTVLQILHFVSKHRKLDT